MKTQIVITTINKRSAGMDRFLQFENSEVIVVGDRKTPPYENAPRLVFLPYAKQSKLGFCLARKLPTDHYSRKNLGYLQAFAQQAKTIYDTDDDNLPYPDWSFPEFLCDRYCAGQHHFVNMYRYFTETFIWPRGFPLDEINNQEKLVAETGPHLRVGVWQGLADGDPDVDAIFRLLHDQPTHFEKGEPIILRSSQYCPFNSQNTLWSSEAFAYLYLPVTVSFRYTDILRSYIAQRGLWALDLHVGFTRATVYQERNPHNLMKDFADEVPAYLGVKRICEVLDSLRLERHSLNNLHLMYRALVDAELVPREEMTCLEAWISDCKTVLGNALR